MEIILKGPLAADSAAGDFDVRQMKKALNRLGFYTPPYKDIGITGLTDNALFAAIRAYQTVRGLLVTGQIKPDDETLNALNDDLATAPEGYYIWRTVGDDKVRSEHAQYNGTIRAWRDAPDPGEDYNCRCWAEAVDTDDPRLYPDAIHPTIGPFDLMGGGAALKSGVTAATIAVRAISARSRDVRWIGNTLEKQFQKKFKHARIFGIKGSFNRKNLTAFKKALEEHVKSPDTRIIKGSYHKRPVIHYYNGKTKRNIIRNQRGEFESAWRLSDEQIEHILRTGKLGGSK